MYTVIIRNRAESMNVVPGYYRTLEEALDAQARAVAAACEMDYPWTVVVAQGDREISVMRVPTAAERIAEAEDVVV